MKLVKILKKKWNKSINCFDLLINMWFLNYESNHLGHEVLTGIHDEARLYRGEGEDFLIRIFAGILAEVNLS